MNPHGVIIHADPSGRDGRDRDPRLLQLTTGMGICLRSYKKEGCRGLQRKTAAAMTVVQRPSITPSADWQVWVVLMIRPLAL